MEWNELSSDGKKKLRRWYEKQQKNNVRMCISKILSGAKDEQDLFKTCRRINRAIKILREDTQTTSEASEHDIDPESSTEDSCDGLAPETFKTVYMEDDSAPESIVVDNRDYQSIHKALMSPTQIKYNAFSSRTKGRINEIIQTHMDVPISQMISDATDEAEMIRFLEEIECREVVVNPEIRFWICREVI